MGKQRSSVLRRKAEKLFEMFQDRFSDNFDQNKRFLDTLHIFNDKISRNIIAGIIVKMVKTKRAEQAAA
ncbi:30S ribosomal protein S17e [Candidatus Micrarchaeota archaeon]|nr:30S ribosomal protein S17e [Candidatus Micrarchaeota archaeon]